MVELRADLGGERGVRAHGVPVEEQVVVVQGVGRKLSLYITTEKAGQLLFPIRTPREQRLQRFLERALRIHPVRVDREAGVLAREALFGLGEAALVAHEVDEVGDAAD